MSIDTKLTQILLVDDDDDALALLQLFLQRGGYHVVLAQGGEQALAQLAVTQPHLVITDLVMSKMDGMALLSRIHKLYPVMPVIMLSGQAQIPDAVGAIQEGVIDFLTKPIQQHVLLKSVQKALQNNHGHHSVVGKHPSLGTHIIHCSTVMQNLLERARRVAMSHCTVFINGDTGTGKEVLAKAIHEHSTRAMKPFIAVNCGALPEQLLESELFGHEKGAFTGAVKKHKGLFLEADQGTLFLDEIGDIPLSLQVKLLRVLEESVIRPIGSAQNIPVDVRIISATHMNLEEAVNQGEFREDLYYRLHVVPLHIPSLTDRREDIPLLVEYFLTEFSELHRSESQKAEKRRFSADAIEYLVSAPWPGNVRQLRNIVEQCTVLSSANVIPLELAQQALQDQSGEMLTLEQARAAFEHQYLSKLLKITEGSVANAARIAGRNRTEFYRLLQRHQLKPVDFRKTKCGK